MASIFDQIVGAFLGADKFGQRLMLRSPREASRTYGFDTSHNAGAWPRAKFEFFAEFYRADGSSFNEGFIVKSVDRPNFKPESQELNQYNKKRQVYTGYKMNELSMTFVDTADHRILKFWYDYARSYFADFRQSADTAWHPDVVRAEMYDDGQGFGFTPSPYQNFIEKMKLYQLHGGGYVEIDVINPRIVDFTGDELDYSNSEFATYRIGLVYEAVRYPMGIAPRSVFSNAALVQAFELGPFNGDVYDPQDFPAPSFFLNSPFGNLFAIPIAPELASSVENLFGVAAAISVGARAVAAISSSATNAAGALALFGAYSFGASLAPIATSAVAGMASNAAVTLGGVLPPLVNPSDVLAGPPPSAFPQGVDGASANAALALAVQNQQLGTSALAASQATGEALTQQIQSFPSGNANAILPSDATLAQQNNVSTTAQYGTNNSTIPLPARKPTPPTQNDLTPSRDVGIA